MPSIKPKWYSKSIRSGALCLFLLLLLTSCATIRVPDFFGPCSITYLEAKEPTLADIVLVAQAREYDVRACEADKRALEAFIKAHPKLSIERTKVVQP